MGSKGGGKFGEVFVIHATIMEILHYQSMAILHFIETVYFHNGSLVRRTCLVHFSTMFSADYIYELVEKRRKELGLSQAEVCLRAFGKADNTAIQSLRKGSSPGIDRVFALAEALNLEFYLGEHRDLGPVEQVTLDHTAYARVALHEAELAAGPGALNGNEEIIEYLVFRRDWLRKIGVSPANARLARVRGESMQPTLAPGDMVLIDTAQSTVPIRPRQAAKPLRADLYAVHEDSGARIKRVEHSTSGELWLHSDNTALRLPPERRTGIDAEQLGIIGKVVWWGHTVER